MYLTSPCFLFFPFFLSVKSPHLSSFLSSFFFLPSFFILSVSVLVVLLLLSSDSFLGDSFFCFPNISRVEIRFNFAFTQQESLIKFLTAAVAAADVVAAVAAAYDAVGADDDFVATAVVVADVVVAAGATTYTTRV